MSVLDSLNKGILDVEKHFRDNVSQRVIVDYEIDLNKLIQEEKYMFWIYCDMGNRLYVDIPSFELDNICVFFDNMPEVCRYSSLYFVKRVSYGNRWALPSNMTAVGFDLDISGHSAYWSLRTIYSIYCALNRIKIDNLYVSLVWEYNGGHLCYLDSVMFKEIFKYPKTQDIFFELVKYLIGRPLEDKDVYSIIDGCGRRCLRDKNLFSYE